MSSVTIGSLCSGYGGLELAVHSVLGGRVAWHSEVDPAASAVLDQRFPGVPNIGDMTSVDWSNVEPVDVLEGGTPCQDVSHAGKRAGMRAGTRSGLWSAMVDAIDVLRPRLVVWENVRGVLSAAADSDLEHCPVCVGDGSGDALRALGRVLGDLADSGYDARWCGLPASAVGAPHKRFRVFVVAAPADTAQRAGFGGITPPDLGDIPVSDGPSVRVDADPADIGHQRGRGTWGRGPGSAHRGIAPGGAGRNAVRQQPVPQPGGSGQAIPGQAGDPVADPDRDGLEELRRVDAGGHDVDGRGDPDGAWGPYEPAVRRWETVNGPAPAPREPGRNGERLSPRFVEWMMGLPAGWVTDVPGVSRNDQLKMLGNGVVPQQAAAALEYLIHHHDGGNAL